MARVLFALVLTIVSSGAPNFAAESWRLNAKSDPKQWQPMPTWLLNPSLNATVTATDEGLRFLVPEAGKGMKWLINARWVNTNRFRYFVVRYRAHGLNTQSRDYFIWVNDSSRRPDEERYLLRLSDLVGDGQWHFAVADLREFDIQPYLSQLALQVQASEPNCEVIVSEISFRDRLPEGVQLPTKPLPPYRERPLDLSILAKAQAQPTWLANPAEQAVVQMTREGVRFSVKGFNKGIKWSVNFDPSLTLAETPMLLIEYRAIGIASRHDYFVYTAPRQPKLPQSNYHAVWLEELVSDGKWHQILVKLPEPAQNEISTLAIQVQSESEEAEVTIRSIKFVNRAPEPTGWLDEFLPQAPKRDGKLLSLGLTKHCNINLGQLGLDLPVREFRFRSKTVYAAGIPFFVSNYELNGIAADSEIGEIPFKLPQIPEPTRPTEVYLLLAASFPRYEEPSYGGGRLWRIRHPHRFVVEVIYADGTSETYFPLRVLSRRPEIVSGLDVYVVPLRKMAKGIRLHDRMRLGEFALCGLTLNLGQPHFEGTGDTGQGTSLWDVLSLPKAKMTPLLPPREVAIEQQPEAITLRNANLQVRIQTEPVQLNELILLPVNRNILVKPAPLFAVTSWDESNLATSADYKLANVQVGKNSAILDLQPPSEQFPAVRLILQMDEHAILQFQAILQNKVKQTQRWKFHLPAHWQLRIGDGDFYAYPLRTVVISDAENEFRYRYGGFLPLQFLDLSNPKVGIGVGLLTKDLVGLDRFVDLRREGDVTTIGIRWRCDPILEGTLPSMLKTNAKGFSPTEVGAQKFVSDYRLKPVAWLSHSARQRSTQNSERLTQNAQHIAHATGFSQWLMTQENERRIYSALICDLGAHKMPPKEENEQILPVLEIGQVSPALTVELFVHAGDWRQTFERYKAWVQTWYRPIAPRKDWFRKVFAFRQDYIDAGLFDFAARTYRFAERVQFAHQAFGACDYLHIFDWGATLNRGRVGDYDPWGNRLTSADEFREAVIALQRSGVPVGLYIEGYLIDERSHIGKAHREDWGLRNHDGSVQLWEPGSPEFVMCPGAKGWQDYFTQVYRRVHKETNALGFYIDQFGFCHRDCFAQNHDHPPDWNVLRGEGVMTKQVREALPPECVLYTESFPPEIHTVLQDGSFDYAIHDFQIRAYRWMPVPVRLGRFIFPDFKVLQIIVCDLPVGTNEEAVKQVFFNGDGYWLQGEPESWWQQETLDVLRRCIAVLKEHSDAFAGNECEPLVPTLVNGVFANRFSSALKTVWTLYNANWRSVSGEILAVPHVDGARYFDAWNGKEIKPRIVGKTAFVSLKIEPHGVGCVVQRR